MKNSKTLGFNIIKLLSEQLDSTIYVLPTEKGVGFKITIPAKRLKK